MALGLLVNQEKAIVARMLGNTMRTVRFPVTRQAGGSNIFFHFEDVLNTITSIMACEKQSPITAFDLSIITILDRLCY